MNKPLKVIVPEKCRNYLTPNKEYEVIGYSKYHTSHHGQGFFIYNDLGEVLFCLEKNDDGHTFLQPWIITERI